MTTTMFSDHCGPSNHSIKKVKFVVTIILLLHFVLCLHFHHDVLQNITHPLFGVYHMIVHIVPIVIEKTCLFKSAPTSLEPIEKTFEHQEHARNQ